MFQDSNTYLFKITNNFRNTKLVFSIIIITILIVSIGTVIYFTLKVRSLSEKDTEILEPVLKTQLPPKTYKSQESDNFIRSRVGQIKDNRMVLEPGLSGITRTMELPNDVVYTCQGEYLRTPRGEYVSRAEMMIQTEYKDPNFKPPGGQNRAWFVKLAMPGDVVEVSYLSGPAPKKVVQISVMKEKCT